MTVTDLDEWLRPGAGHGEVALDVDDLTEGLVLRASLVVTPAGRRVQLAATVDGAGASHGAEEAGPPATNWDPCA